MKIIVPSEHAIEWARRHRYHAESVAEACLLQFIARNFNEDGEAYLTLAEISDTTRLNPRTIRKLLTKSSLVDIIQAVFRAGLDIDNKFIARNWLREAGDCS